MLLGEKWKSLAGEFASLGAAGVFLLGVSAAWFDQSVPNWNMHLLGLVLLLQAAAFVASAVLFRAHLAQKLAWLLVVLMLAASFLSRLVPEVFLHFRFPVGPFQISVGLLLALALVAYPRGTSDASLPAFKMLVLTLPLIGAIGFYVLQISGTTVSETHFLSSAHYAMVETGRSRPTFQPKAKMHRRALTDCARRISGIQLEPLSGSKRSVRGRVLLHGKPVASFDLDQRQPWSMTFTGTAYTPDIVLEFFDSDPAFRVPSIIVKEKCPFFIPRTFGCLDFHCSACIEAEGW